MKAQLKLSDGTIFEGESFGAPVSTSGEVVFNTGMVGYTESLTDPSYYGQILALTYPLVGNYGVPQSLDFESKKIQAKALIVQNYSKDYSHFQALESLGEWLKREGIPGIQGIDTRELTRKLREYGVMLGSIQIGDQKTKQGSIYDPNVENVLPNVSVADVENYGEGKKHIVLIDCGAKENIVRSLVSKNVRVSRVPWNFNPLKADFDFDGVLISNGPGDPKQAKETIETVKQLLKEEVPTFGICLGSQILALAAGGNTYKLKFGHRGQNQPVIDKITNKAIITSQNHGFAVDTKSLGKDWEEWFVNLNDGTNEGVRHKKKPFMAVQFHPENTPGPLDASYLFDEFISHL